MRRRFYYRFFSWNPPDTYIEKTSEYHPKNKERGSAEIRRQVFEQLIVPFFKCNSGLLYHSNMNAQVDDIKKWRCGVCGYETASPEPPDICPMCGAPREAFEEI